MKHKKITAPMIALSLILALGLTGCAAALGAYPNNDLAPVKEPISADADNSEKVTLSGSKDGNTGLPGDPGTISGIDDPETETLPGGTGLTERTGTPFVSFFDEQMKEITEEAGWYSLAQKTVLRIAIDGDMPDRIEVYLTPSGTETADLQKQIAEVIVADNKTSDIELEFKEPVMGYLQAAMVYGDRTVVSDLYNVYSEGN